MSPAYLSCIRSFPLSSNLWTIRPAVAVTDCIPVSTPQAPLQSCQARPMLSPDTPAEPFSSAILRSLTERTDIPPYASLRI